MQRIFTTLLLAGLTLITTVCYAEISNFEQGVINTTQMIKQDLKGVCI